MKTIAIKPVGHGLPQAKTQRGVVILESLIAVLIFSFGIIALLGLQAVMLKSASGTEYRSDAIFVAQQRLGMLWADPTNLAAYGETNTPIGTLLPNGTRTTVVLPATPPSTVQTEVRITVNWQQPGEPVHTYSTSARMTGA